MINSSGTLVCLFTLWLGLRPGEFCNVRKSDIDFTRQVMILRDTKSGGDQPVPIPDELLDLLHQATVGLQPDDYVFVHSKGGPIRRPQVEKRIRRWCNARGVQDVTPQTIRRSLALLLENHGALEIQVQSLLRHKGSSTNRRHYAKINLDAARAALKHHPARDC